MASLGRWRGRWLAVVAVVGGLAIPAVVGDLAGADVNAVAGRIFRYTGSVVDPTGTPLAGVSVAARTVRNGQPVWESFARTGDDGRFGLWVAPGQLRLELTIPCEPEVCGDRAEPLGRMVHEELLAEGASSHNVELVLPVVGLVSGRVYGPDGQTVHLASVSLWSLEGLVGAVRADREGRYRLDEPVPVGRQSAEVRYGRRYGEVHRWVEIRPGLNQLDFHLPTAISACVKVVDQDGQPVAGANVELLEPASFFDPREGVATDQSGLVELPVARAGVYLGRAEAAGYASVERFFSVRRDTTDCSELVLRRGLVTIEGRVKWAEGVLAEPLIAEYPHAMEAEVDPISGRFEIVDVQPGYGTLILRSSASSRLLTLPLAVPSDRDRRPVEVVVERGHDLAVRVTREGEPMAGHFVALQGSEPRQWSNLCADEQGQVLFVGLPAGKYVLQPGRRAERTVSVPAEQEVVLELAHGGRSRLVLDLFDQSGEPFQGRATTILRVDTAQGTEVADEIESSTLGRKVFQSRPGAGVLRALVDEHLPIELSVAIPAKEEVHLRLSLARGPAVVVRGLGPGGMVPFDLYVSAVEEEDWLSPISRPTRADGGVTLRSLPPGEHEIEVTAFGYGSSRGNVVVPGPPVLFELPVASSLLVEVPALARNPAPAELRVYGEDGEQHPLFPLDPARPRRFDGASWMELDLAPGRWRVEVTAADGRQWEGDAVVVEGERLALTLTGEGLQ